MPRCFFIADGDALELGSPYDPGFVAALKAAVPPNERAWKASRKAWLISPRHATKVADLCERYFGEAPVVPSLRDLAPPTPQVRVITLEYLGQVKFREDFSKSAYGYADGAWSVIAPEDVLRAWFAPAPAWSAPGEPAKPAAPETLYGLLGVAQDADDAALKQAYKRMARQWHPDVCREPDAGEMFLKVKAAYDVLGDPLRRRKYNAGLKFEQARQPERRGYVPPPPPFRAPLRCGLVVAEAMPRLGRWELTKILQWIDITDGAGRVMVTSWDTEQERISVKWVDA